MINRSQGLVLAFFATAIVAVAVIVAVAPSTLGSIPTGFGFVFVAGLAALLAFLSLAVLRRWRWTFWLIVLAFLAGALRVPATFLELNGVIARQGPDWYVVVQGAIGIVQLVIGVLLVRGYRRAGVWGPF